MLSLKIYQNANNGHVTLLNTDSTRLLEKLSLVRHYNLVHWKFALLRRSYINSRGCTQPATDCLVYLGWFPESFEYLKRTPWMAPWGVMDGVSAGGIRRRFFQLQPSNKNFSISASAFFLLSICLPMGCHWEYLGFSPKGPVFQQRVEFFVNGTEILKLWLII